MRARLAAIPALLLLLLVAGSAPAAHGQSAGSLTIVSIENRYPNFLAVVSALDGAGNPITGVDERTFVIDEDGLAADVVAVRPTDDQINVVIALDTSGSMGFGAAPGRGIDGARAAVLSFLQQLREGDNVALLTFDDRVRLRSDFTYDKGLIRNLLVQLEPPRGSTSLYQAIVDASALAGRSPSGRRLLLLLTDGEDEPPGGVGPKLGEAIAAAQGANMPVFALGFGSEVKPPILAEIAQSTKGQSQITPDAADLTDRVLRYHRQVTQQWAIQYRSKSPPGQHRVTIGVRGSEAKDQRTFEAPAIPPKVEAPRAIQARGPVVISYSRVALQSEAVKIGRVEYLLDGQETPAFVTTEAPWSWTWDTTGLDAQSRAVTVRVVDSAGQVGTSDPIDLHIERAAWLVWPVPFLGNRYLLVEPIHAALAAIVAILVLLLGLVIARRSQPMPLDILETAAPLDRTGDIAAIQPTAELSTLGPGIATLEVVQGDADQIKRLYDVQPPVVLGRDSAVCGIAINDSRSLVSRTHAEIRLEGDQFVVYDRSSKYHTYVNGRRVVGAIGRALNDNDVLSLGPALVLRFRRVAFLGFDDDSDEGTGDIVDHPDEQTDEVRLVLQG